MLLIHGWGMHGGVWDDVARRLAADFQVHCVDLPGYGYSKNVGWVERSDTHHLPEIGDGYRYAQPILQAVVDELSSCFSDPITVCGWSLGGHIALELVAQRPLVARPAGELLDAAVRGTHVADELHRVSGPRPRAGR